MPNTDPKVDLHSRGAAGLIAEARRLSAAASPEPWAYEEGRSGGQRPYVRFHSVVLAEMRRGVSPGEAETSIANAAFIARARTLVPELATALEELSLQLRAMGAAGGEQKTETAGSGNDKQSGEEVAGLPAYRAATVSPSVPHPQHPPHGARGGDAEDEHDSHPQVGQCCNYASRLVYGDCRYCGRKRPANADDPIAVPVAPAPSASNPHGDGSRVEGQWVIWSDEHRAWWRPDRSGYTSHLPSAGRYTYEEAHAATKHCGPEKAITLLSVTHPAGARSVLETDSAAQSTDEVAALQREVQLERRNSTHWRNQCAKLQSRKPEEQHPDSVRLVELQNALRCGFVVRVDDDGWITEQTFKGGTPVVVIPAEILDSALAPIASSLTPDAARPHE